MRLGTCLRQISGNFFVGLHRRRCMERHQIDFRCLDVVLPEFVEGVRYPVLLFLVCELHRPKR
jgi:hypothetical protein